MKNLPKDELAIAKGFVAYVDNQFKDNDILMLSDEQELLLEYATLHLIELIRNAKDPQPPATQS